MSQKKSLLKLEGLIQYLFLFGCPFHSRECYLLFHFRKKIAIHYSVNQMGAETGQLGEIEPPVQSNGGLCGCREYKLQDRTESEEIDLLDPFPEKEAALVLSSCPKGPDL